MNGIEIIILIGVVVAVVAGIGYYMNYGQPTLKEMKEEKVKEVPEGIVEEPAKKETKPEFPIDKPKKKRKYYPKKK